MRELHVHALRLQLLEFLEFRERNARQGLRARRTLMLAVAGRRSGHTRREGGERPCSRRHGRRTSGSSRRATPAFVSSDAHTSDSPRHLTSASAPHSAHAAPDIASDDRSSETLSSPQNHHTDNINNDNTNNDTNTNTIHGCVTQPVQVGPSGRSRELSGVRCAWARLCC
eukprot:1236243-Rhodomonas_salina.3